MTGGTGSVFIVGILNENEDTRTINTTTNNNNKTVQVAYVIDRDGDSDEVSKYNTEYSDYVVSDEEMPNFHE